ncbi:MAG: hypothetical protein KJ630_14715 [Proteobacteria bacterium]|nr:hypothetical protein [Pseudomonadota bacterium]
MKRKQSTTLWKEENGLKSMNFCIPFALWIELQNMKTTLGATLSSMIRDAIRLYLKERKKQIADEELRELQEYNVRKQHQGRRLNNGFFPDF